MWLSSARLIHFRQGKQLSKISLRNTHALLTFVSAQESLIAMSAYSEKISADRFCVSYQTSLSENVSRLELVVICNLHRSEGLRYSLS